MLRLTFSSIRARKARFLLTSVAVILGVALVTGTLVLTDTIERSYDDMVGGVYGETDAVVQSARTVQGDEGRQVRGTVDARLVEQVAAVPGVAAAEPQIAGVALVVGKDGELLDDSPNRPAPVALGWQSDDRLNPMDLVDGHAPAADEIVIDAASARAGRFAVGDTVTVLHGAGARQYTLAGIATYAGSDDAAGAQVVAFAPGTAADVLGEPGRYDAVHVVAAPGVSERALAASIRAAVGSPEVEVLTGTEALEQARDAAGASMEFLRTFLMTFAIVAMLVGSFVIYNTFSITTAQRTRDHALLRAIGARRGQVLRSLVAESLVVGVFASAIGVLAGLVIVRAIVAVFTIVDVELPSADFAVTGSTVRIAMAIGTVVTVVAAYLPARRAARVAPIAALREVAVDRSGTSRRRAAGGTLVTLLGAASVYSGLSAGEFQPVAMGAILVFVGVAVLGPVIARPFARVVGAPLPVLFGIPGTLARENATRNPRRTAATASALMVGVGLAAFMTVLAASNKSSMGASIDSSVRSDWIVETAWGMGGLSPEATARIDALPETGSVSPVRFTTAEIGGSGSDLIAFDPTDEEGLDLHAVDGDLAGLSPAGIAVWRQEAVEEHLSVGDPVVVTFPETGEQTFTVEATYAEQGPSNGYAISLEAFEANVSEVVDQYVAVNTAPGVPPAKARAAVEAVLADYPNAGVKTPEEFKGSLAARIDQMLHLVYVLLFMALTIALFGIANSLALSVFERTREIGLLRAVGASRRQLRRSVRWESALIALVGTALGVTVGIGLAWALVESLHDKGLDTFTIPATQLASVVVTATLASVLAAAVAARRAARTNVLEAVTA